MVKRKYFKVYGGPIGINWQFQCSDTAEEEKTSDICTSGSDQYVAGTFHCQASRCNIPGIIFFTGIGFPCINLTEY